MILIRTRRAIWIAPQVDGSEIFVQRVVKQQTSGECLTDAQKYLESFHRFDRTDDARKNTENTRLCARRCEFRRRWLGE